MIEPGRGVCVDGDDVDIDRICCLSGDFIPGFAEGGADLCADVCFTAACVEIFTWV